MLMDYFRTLLSNLKRNSQILGLFLTTVAVLVAFLIGFNSFPQEKLPIFLQQTCLLIYLYFLLALTLLIIILCFAAPLIASKTFNLSWEYLIDKNKSLERLSAPLMFSTLFLLGIGGVMIYSFSSPIALVKFGSDNYFLKRQSIWALISISIVPLFIYFRYAIIRHIALGLLLFTIMIFVFKFLGINLIDFSTKNDGYNLSSFAVLNYFNLAKISFIIYTASFLSKEKIRTISILPLVIFLILLFCLCAEPLSQVSFFLICGFFIALVRINRKFSSVFLLILIIAYISTTFLLLLKSFDVGGIFGVGIGRGLNKLFYSNFIIETVLEELGFIGVFIVFTLFMLYFLQTIKIVRSSKVLFAKLLAFGIAVTFCLQVLFHIWGFLGFLSLSYFPLPFFTYEGPEVIINIILTIIILNVSMSQTINSKGKRGQIYV